MPVTTKFGRGVTQNEALPLIKSLDFSITWSFWVTWQIKYVIFWLVLDQQSPSNGRFAWRTYRDELSLIITLKKCCRLSLRDKLKAFNFYLYTTPLVTKIVRLTTYYKELPRLKSHDSLITWSSPLARFLKCVWPFCEIAKYRVKVTCLFDQVTNLISGDKLRTLCSLSQDL